MNFFFSVTSLTSLVSSLLWLLLPFKLPILKLCRNMPYFAYWRVFRVFVLLRFLQRIKNCRKKHTLHYFWIIRSFPEKSGLIRDTYSSPSIILPKSKKSLEQLLRSQCDELPTNILALCSTEAGNIIRLGWRKFWILRLSNDQNCTWNLALQGY